MEQGCDNERWGRRRQTRGTDAERRNVDAAARVLPRSCEEQVLQGHRREPHTPRTPIPISFLEKNTMVQAALRCQHPRAASLCSPTEGQAPTHPFWAAPGMRVSPEGPSLSSVPENRQQLALLGFKPVLTPPTRCLGHLQDSWEPREAPLQDPLPLCPLDP